MLVITFGEQVESNHTKYPQFPQFPLSTHSLAYCLKIVKVIAKWIIRLKHQSFWTHCGGCESAQWVVLTGRPYISQQHQNSFNFLFKILKLRELFDNFSGASSKKVSKAIKLSEFFLWTQMPQFRYFRQSWKRSSGKFQNDDLYFYIFQKKVSTFLLYSQIPYNKF